MNPNRYYAPIRADVAEAMLKGATHNKKLKMMTMRIPRTDELKLLVDKVAEVNKKLRLNVGFVM